jgi:hypothetical protein
VGGVYANCVAAGLPLLGDFGGMASLSHCIRS